MPIELPNKFKGGGGGGGTQQPVASLGHEAVAASNTPSSPPSLQEKLSAVYAGPKIRDFFVNEAEFAWVLGEAKGNAQGSWAENFVHDVETRATKFGFDAPMTQQQAETLRRIMKGDT